MKDFVSMSSLGSFGWFGNQLFQYAALKMYAKERDVEVEVPENWIGRNVFVDCNDPVISKESRIQKTIKGENPIWLNGEDLNTCDIKGYFQYHTNFYDEEYFRSLFRFVPKLEQSLGEPLTELKAPGVTLVSRWTMRSP